MSKIFGMLSNCITELNTTIWLQWYDKGSQLYGDGHLIRCRSNVCSCPCTSVITRPSEHNVWSAVNQTKNTNAMFPVVTLWRCSVLIGHNSVEISDMGQIYTTGSFTAVACNKDNLNRIPLPNWPSANQVLRIRNQTACSGSVVMSILRSLSLCLSLYPPF